MSVDTLLRKEKDGTLGGYKLAAIATTHDLLQYMTPADRELVVRMAPHSLYREPTSLTPKRRLLGILPGKAPSEAELDVAVQDRIRDAAWNQRHPEHW